MMRSQRSAGLNVPTFAFNPSLQMVSQSALDCSEAAGDVTSIYTANCQPDIIRAPC